MPLHDLTQREADALLAMEKRRANDSQHAFPSLGGSLRIPLKSGDAHEEFILDITRSRLELRKNTFQTRARSVVILARVDLEGGIHRNPDGDLVPCPHLHSYREGFGDKWASPLPEAFSSPNDSWQVLQDFMLFCNITEKPDILPELFT